MTLPATQHLVQSLLERLTDEASVRKVYGESIVVNQKTIIPVAKVMLGFGGGFGEGHARSEKTSETEPENGKSEGGGLGSGFILQPQGVIEITPTYTRYLPLSKGRYVAMGVVLGFLLSKLVNRRK
ncbi:GerW family sporulation protein [Spirosoma litoris]